MLRRIGDPDGIALITQSRFKQFDRLDHNDALAGTPGKDIDCLEDIWMDNILQLFQRVLIGEDKMSKLGAVDLAILLKQP